MTLKPSHTIVGMFIIAAASLPGVPWPLPLAAIVLYVLHEGLVVEPPSVQNRIFEACFTAFALRFFLVFATAVHVGSLECLYDDSDPYLCKGCSICPWMCVIAQMFQL